MYATKLQGYLKMTFLALQISTLTWCYKQTESFSLSTKTYMSPLPLQVKHSVGRCFEQSSLISSLSLSHSLRGGRHESILTACKFS